MIEKVKGKPIRGTLSNVGFRRQLGYCTGTLISPDHCAGQEGRRYLRQYGTIHTSTVDVITVVEGSLVIVTRNSAYLVEGGITIIGYQDRGDPVTAHMVSDIPKALRKRKENGGVPAESAITAQQPRGAIS